MSLDQIPLMSLDKMLKLARKRGIEVTRAELQQHIKNNRVAQITKPVRLNEQKQKVFDHIVAPNRELGHFQVDLLDMSKWAKHNKGHHFALVLIDINSRFGLVKPLKNKTAGEVWAAFKQLLDGGLMKHKVLSVTSDNGSEFEGAFRKGLADLGIKQTMNQAGDHYTMGMVERFNRTLRGRFVKHWIKNKDFDWIGVLSEVVRDYNQSEHRGIKAVPEEVWLETVEVPVRLRNPQHLAEGTLVRRLINKSIFDKGETSRWSHSVYVVDGKVGQKYWLKTKEGERLDTPVSFHRLQVVTGKDEDEDNEKQAEAEEGLARQRRFLRRMQREGIEQENIGLRRLRGDERALRPR